MPSNMVTGGDPTALEAPIPTPQTYAQTLQTNKPLLPHLRFSIQQWSPRTGYGKISERFKSDLSRLFKALGLSLEDLETPCPLVADPLTKYLSYAVWNRHMHYLLNANPPGYKSEGKVQWN